jgi:hypothetical protein
MYKIIGSDEKEYGPVTADQLRKWVIEGRADARTRVRGEGQDAWTPLGALAEFGDAFPPVRGWTCPKCGETIEEQFDSCWRCRTPRPAPPGAVPALPVASVNPPAIAASPRPRWRVKYKMFRGTFATWATLFDEAAAFASEVGRDRLIGISHSEDKDDGVVAVWYWAPGPGD